VWGNNIVWGNTLIGAVDGATVSWGTAGANATQTVWGSLEGSATPAMFVLTSPEVFE
jgi:hypothetical protein